MLETRIVTDLKTICPAGQSIGETPAGSAILCRITAKVVASGTDPSSLRAFCCYPHPADRDITTDGQEVKLGYQNCPVWRYLRGQELKEKMEFKEGTPTRVKEAWEAVGTNMITPA